MGVEPSAKSVSLRPPFNSTTTPPSHPLICQPYGILDSSLCLHRREGTAHQAGVSHSKGCKVVFSRRPAVESCHALLDDDKPGYNILFLNSSANSVFLLARTTHRRSTARPTGFFCESVRICSFPWLEPCHVGRDGGQRHSFKITSQHNSTLVLIDTLQYACTSV